MRIGQAHGVRSTAVAIALTATALFAIAALPAGAATSTKPNIVVIMSDDERQDDAAIMTKMKSLLAAQGTTFANSYVSYSLCCPSRASFLTGQYMHNHGVTWNFWPEGGYFKLKHSTNDGGWANTMPTWLQNAGYHTGLIGKYLNQTGTEDPTTEVMRTATGVAGSSTVTVNDATGLEVGMTLTDKGGDAAVNPDVLKVNAGIPAFSTITRISGNTVTLSNKLTATLSGTNNFLAGKANPKEIPPGWSEWVGGVDPTTYSAYGYTLNVNGTLKTFGHCAQRADLYGVNTNAALAGCQGTAQVADRINKDGTAYQTDVLSTYAEKFISTNSKKTKPFFLWLTPNAPHTATASGLGEGSPAIYPTRYATRNFDSQWTRDVASKPSFNELDVSDKPGINGGISIPCIGTDPFVNPPGGNCSWFQYMGPAEIALQKKHFVARRRAVLGVDDMVNRVYNAVKKAGKLSNTIFIFTSDNGWLMGEHRVPANKLFGFDESIRVPLVIKGPGFNKTGGQTVSATAINVDLAPTILKAAGATPGRSMDGVPLQDVVANQAGWANRTVAIEVGPNPRAAHYSGIHNDHWHLEKIEGGGLPLRYELYDLSKDPFELNAVTNDPRYSSVLETLKAQLESLATCKGRACDDVGHVPASP